MRLSRFESKCLLAALFFVGLGPFVVRPLCRTVDPRVAVADFEHLRPGQRFEDPDELQPCGEKLDPWGHEWVRRRIGTTFDYDGRKVVVQTLAGIYSCGPNGKDDGAEGDDVTVWDRSGHRSPGPFFTISFYSVRFCSQLGLLALAIALCARRASAPMGPPRREVSRVAVLTLPFFLIVGASFFLYPDLAGAFEKSVTTWLPIPWQASVGGTLWVTLYVAALAVRLKLARPALDQEAG